jgi:hypothetical protein
MMAVGERAQRRSNVEGGHQDSGEAERDAGGLAMPEDLRFIASILHKCNCTVLTNILQHYLSLSLSLYIYI